MMISSLVAIATTFALLGDHSVHAFVTPSTQQAAVPKSAWGVVSTPKPFSIVAPTTNVRSPSSVLFMGWGPEPIWSTATVKTNVAANKSGKSSSITVEIPVETAQEYKIPGQYVQLRLNEETKPLFLAIASAPDAENAVFEFLIKKTDDNGWITSASPGTSVQISQVLGNGFPMEENLEGFKYDFPTQNVLLFGVGSGIAPLKAAMESGTYTNDDMNFYYVSFVRSVCFGAVGCFFVACCCHMKLILGYWKWKSKIPIAAVLSL